MDGLLLKASGGPKCGKMRAMQQSSNLTFAPPGPIREGSKRSLATQLLGPHRYVTWVLDGSDQLVGNR